MLQRQLFIGQLFFLKCKKQYQGILKLIIKTQSLASFKCMGISESLLKAVEHPKFHKVQYGTEKPITIVHFQTDDYEINHWRDQFYKKFNHQDQSNYPSLLMVPQEHVKIVRDGFCTEKCKLLIKVQNIWEATLQEQIVKRGQIQRYYTEEQIWLFCFNICETLVPLHSLHETSILGNLHPANILMSKQGEILMIGQSSLPYERDHYTTFRKKGIKQSYVSPQLIGFLNNIPSKNQKQTAQYPACVDPQKAESYCLGLTLLAFSCLQPSMQYLYLLNARNLNYLSPNVSRQSSSRHNYSNLINQTFFNERIHFIETRYSRVLSMVIKGFLQNLPENRLSVSQLWNVFLKQKKGHILSMDTNWYFQTLEPIDQFHQDQNYASEKQSGQKSLFANKNKGRQVQLKDQESKTYENFYSSNDQRIQIWQRSLQNEQIVPMAKEKRPSGQIRSKISFTYDNAQ